MLGIRLKNLKETEKEIEFPIFSDYKYDGIRLQIHKFKNEIKLFSRNLENLTEQFEEVKNFFLTNFKEENFILDCECIAYDFEKEEFLEFQILSKRILSKNKEAVKNIKTQIKLFDIMKLNEKNLIDLNYEKRREILTKLLIGRNLEQ